MQNTETFSFKVGDQSKQVNILSVANLIKLVGNNSIYLPDPNGLIEFYKEFRSLLVEFKNLKNIQENTERQFAVWVVVPLGEFFLIINQSWAFDVVQNKSRFIDWLGNLRVSIKTFENMCSAWCPDEEPIDTIKRILADCQVCSNTLLERLR
jgi:hypothetical protein